jgi:hypothetical protein
MFFNPNQNYSNQTSLPSQQPGVNLPPSPYGSFAPSHPQEGISKGKKIAIAIAVTIFCLVVISFLRRILTDRHQTSDDVSSNFLGGSSKNSSHTPKSDLDILSDKVEKAILYVKRRDFFKSFAKNPLLINYYLFDKIKTELMNRSVFTDEDSKFCFNFLRNFNYLNSTFKEKNYVLHWNDVPTLIIVEPFIRVYGIPWKFLDIAKTLDCTVKHKLPEIEKFYIKIFKEILDPKVNDFGPFLDLYEKEILELYILFPLMIPDLKLRNYYLNLYEIHLLRCFIIQVWKSNLLRLMIEKYKDDMESEISEKDKEFAEKLKFNVTKFNIKLDGVKRFVSPAKDFNKLPIFPKASPDVIDSIYNDYKNSGVFVNSRFVPYIFKNQDDPDLKNKDFGRIPAYVFKSVKKRLEEETKIFIEKPISLFNMNFLIISAEIVELGPTGKFPDDFPEMFYEFSPILCAFNGIPEENATMRARIGQYVVDKLKNEGVASKMKSTVDGLLGCVSPNSLPAFYKGMYKKFLPLCFCIPKLNVFLNYSDKEFELVKKFLNIIWELQIVKAVELQSIHQTLSKENLAFKESLQFDPFVFIPDLDARFCVNPSILFRDFPKLMNISSLEAYQLTQVIPQHRV